MDEELKRLAEDVLKYVTFTPMKDAYDKPYVQVSIQIGKRISVANIVEGKESERESLPVALAALAIHLKEQQPRKVERIRGSSVKDRAI